MSQSRFRQTIAKMDRNKVGWILLFVAFFIGCLTLYLGAFTDEADNLTVGWLMTRGYVLYRDVFSHHFPFAYYWVAAIVSLFGKSIFLVRLSVWLFQVISIAVAMRLSGYTLPLALVALIWAILRPMYRGNMVLYDAFTSVSLLVITAIVLSIVVERKKFGWQEGLALAVYAIIALLSNPLSLYPLAVAFLILLFKDFRTTAFTLAGVCFGLLGFAIHLAASGSLDDFWRGAVLFNSQIYNRYIGTSTIRLKDLFLMIARALEITDKAWYNLDPYKPLAIGSRELDQWFFTGFLFRAALLALTFVLLLRKNYRAAVFIYLFAASLLIMNKWTFRAQSFILLALFAVAILWVQGWKPGRTRLVTYLYQITRLLLLVLMAWLVFRTVSFDYENRRLLTYQANFASLEQQAANLRAFACGQEEVRLAYYPDMYYVHWFTDMEPVSRYLFMYPWVAEIGQQETIDALDNEQLLSLVVRLNSTIWNTYDTTEYLRPLSSYLKSTYVKVEDNTYISKALARVCAEQNP